MPSDELGAQLPAALAGAAEVPLMKPIVAELERASVWEVQLQRRARRRPCSAQGLGMPIEHSEVRAVRRILEDYEAKLRPPPGKRSGRGKVEWERYGDGNEELSARFRKLDLPDGASVEIRLEGAVLGYASISAGAGRLKFQGEMGEDVPKAVAGQVVEVVHEGVVFLAGVFEPD